MTKEEFKAKVSMAYHGFYPDREEWERFLEDMWQLHLQAASHWISVEDELPEETNMYIVVHHNVVCTMLWYDSLEEWADIYVDENECVQSRKMDGVTHWMPLPQPPAKLSSLERNGKKWKE